MKGRVNSQPLHDFLSTGCAGFFVSWGLVQIDKSHFELKAQNFK